MGRDYSPTFRHAHPSLTLATDPFAALTAELNIRHRHIIAEGGNLSGDYGARKVPSRAALPKILDRFESIEVLVSTVAEGQRRIPEQRIKYSYIIAHQGSFVSVEDGIDFGKHIGKVDV